MGTYLFYNLKKEGSICVRRDVMQWGGVLWSIVMKRDGGDGWFKKGNFSVT